jgi:hypothetical protein
MRQSFANSASGLLRTTQLVRQSIEAQPWSGGRGWRSVLDRYIGYYEPYATSHDALDRDAALHVEVRNVARALVEGVKLARAGRLRSPGDDLREPRPK